MDRDHRERPELGTGGHALGATRAETFRLLKLHGSLNWYWTPGDASGVSIARRALPGAFDRPEPYDEEDRRRELPGRVPFVVPPAATKSPYYRNPIVRELWQQAAAALRTARRIVSIGYSLPPADLTFAGMLTASLGSSQTPIVVVDPNPSVVVSRLHTLGLQATNVEESSDSLVGTFVDAWRREIGQAFACDLAATASETLVDPMLVAWAPDAVAAVTGWHATDVIELVIDPPETIRPATRSRDGAPALPSLAEIAEEAATRLITVRGADDRPQVLIDHTLVRVDTGYGHGRWNTFCPSGIAPTP